MFGLITISSFCVIVPLLVGLFRYKSLPTGGRVLTWLMIAWFFTEVSAYYFRVKGQNNWNVYVILSYVEIVIVTVFFRSILISNKAKFVVAIIALTGITIVSTEYIMSDGPSNSVTTMFESFFFFGMGLYSFYEMIILKASGKFSLAVIGIMLTFLGSAVYFASWRFMNEDLNLFKLFGDAHAFLLIICYFIFAIGLWRLQS